MSEEFKPEYKIFEDINLENNKIINVSEISSYDGDDTDKYNSAVKNSGLYIHTPGNSTTISESLSNDKGLIVTTGHAQARLDVVDNISNTINNTVKEHLNVKSNTKTDFVSPVIDIKSTSTPKTEILIRDDKSSDTVEDNGITITTDRTKIISTKSGNKTSEKNSNAVILEFSDSVPSHIDLNRADIYQANTQIFVAGTKYGYSSKDISDAGKKESIEADSENGNALYVDTDKVNIYVNTTIKNTTTSISGELIQQTGNVEINKGVYEGSDPSTTIDGSSLDVNTKTVNIGNLTSNSVDVKTTNINIGTSKTNFDLESHRNILKIGSDYSDLTIKGRDFLIDSDTTKTENISVDDSVKNTAKSYLRSYYTNSNDSYIHDLLTIGPNKKSAKSDSHLQVSGYADITGNLDVDDSIDVMDTVWFHSDNTNTNDNEDGSKNTTSYIKSNNEIIGEVYTQNSSLQINNDNEVIISNATDDIKKISIKPNVIHTKKNLNLDSDLYLAGKLIFDSENSPYSSDVNLIEDLNDINTSSLKVSNKNGKNTVLTISIAKDDNIDTSDSLSIDAKTISLTSINGNNDASNGTINTGRFKQTGNTYINIEDVSNNELYIKGSKTLIESATVNIGSDTNSGTGIINIGTEKDNNNITIGNSKILEGNKSNITIKGKDLELASEDIVKDKPSYLRVSDINTDTVTVKSSITLGPDDSPKTSQLQVNGIIGVTGNLDVNDSIDVKDTIYFHTKDSTEASNKTTSYIKSEYDGSVTSHTEEDKSLRINNHKAVIISNSEKDFNDSVGVTIAPTNITTGKKLILNADQDISGTLTFDGSNNAVDLNKLQTNSLFIKNKEDNSEFLNLSYNTSTKKREIILQPDNLTFDNSTASIKVTANEYTHKVTDSSITGNVKINDGTIINTTDIDGITVSINPQTVNIGVKEVDEETPRAQNIFVGHQSSNITIKGKNNFTLESGTSESKITVDKVSISNSTDGNKVNIYWDPSSSTLIFEKG